MEMNVFVSVSSVTEIKLNRKLGIRVKQFCNHLSQQETPKPMSSGWGWFIMQAAGQFSYPLYCLYFFKTEWLYSATDG